MNARSQLNEGHAARSALRMVYVDPWAIGLLKCVNSNWGHPFSSCASVSFAAADVARTRALGAIPGVCVGRGQMKSAPGSCGEGEAEYGYWKPVKGMDDCLRRCQACAACVYASFHMQKLVCFWYRACEDLDLHDTVWATFNVSRLRESPVRWSDALLLGDAAAAALERARERRHSMESASLNVSSSPACAHAHGSCMPATISSGPASDAMPSTSDEEAQRFGLPCC